MAETKTLTPAYVPFKTFISVLDSFTSFLPDRIDSTMWPSYSGGIKSQLMGALRFFALIDEENQPTEALKGLAKADAQHKPALFGAVMKSAYSGLMALDLTKATPGSFDAEMRKYGQEGDTHRKAASFFLQAAKWTALPLSPLLLKKGGLSGSRRRRPVNGAAKAKSAAEASSFQIKIPNTSLVPPASGPSKEILLSDGSKLVLMAEKDLFRLASEDRKFVMKLLDELETYQSEHPFEEDDLAEDEEEEN